AAVFESPPDGAAGPSGELAGCAFAPGSAAPPFAWPAVAGAAAGGSEPPPPPPACDVEPPGWPVPPRAGAPAGAVPPTDGTAVGLDPPEPPPPLRDELPCRSGFGTGRIGNASR